MGVPAPAGVSASGRSPYWPDDKANGVIQGTIAAVRATRPFAFIGPMNMWIWASFSTSLTTTASSLTAVVGAAGALAAGTAISSTLLPKGTTMSAIGGTNVTLVLPIYTYTGNTKAGIAQITGLQATDYLLGATVTGPGVPSGTTVTAIVTAAVAPTSGIPGSVGTPGVVTISNAITTAPDNNERSPFTFALSSGVIASGVDSAAVFTGAAILYNATVQLERSFDGGSVWLPCNVGGSGGLAQWIGDGSTTGTPVSISFGEPEQFVLYRLNALAYGSVTGTTLNYRISETGQAARTLSIPTLS